MEESLTTLNDNLVRLQKDVTEILLSEIQQMLEKKKHEIRNSIILFQPD